MNVTKENFAEVFPSFVAALSSCDFVAIDEEMTGIAALSPNDRIGRDDCPMTRYNKMVPTATKYRIIQFGISLFHYTGGELPIMASSYNFYIFPETGTDVNLSVSAIEFLKKNNMDFGKWISKGIPYLTKTEEANLIAKMAATTANVATAIANPMVLHRPVDIEHMKRNFDGLKKMVEDTDGCEFQFEPTNAFLRRYTYQTLESDFPDLVVSKADNGCLIASKMTQEAKVLHNEKMEREKLEKQNRMIGFRRVFVALTEANKPIVGHNCMYDLMFMMRWLEDPITECSFDEFRGKLGTLFPAGIYDTKYVSTALVSEAEGEDTTLQACYEREVLQKTGNHSMGVLNIQQAAGFGMSGEQFHDASWDAFCTGCVFAVQREKMKAKGLEEADLRNKLFMMRSVYHIDLDVVRSPSGGEVKYLGGLFYINGYSSTDFVKNDQLIAPFIAAGVLPTRVYPMFIDGKSCFVHVDPVDMATVGGAAEGDVQDNDWTALLDKVGLRIPSSWNIVSFNTFVKTNAAAPVEFESDEGKKIEEEEDDFTFTHVVTTGLRRLSSALFGSMTVDDEADDEGNRAQKRMRE